MKGNYGKFRASPITQFEPEFDPAEVNRGTPAEKTTTTAATNGTDFS